jgi:hypothetical protein
MVAAEEKKKIMEKVMMKRKKRAAQPRRSKNEEDSLGKFLSHQNVLRERCLEVTQVEVTIPLKDLGVYIHCQNLDFPA